MLGFDALDPEGSPSGPSARARAWSRCLALGMLVSASGGCFRYVSVPLETVQLGEGVRLVVTRDGATEYRDVTGATESLPVVIGTLTERDAASLMLQVPVGTRQEGFYNVGIDAAVRVPVSEILDASRRELNTFATGALAVGAAGLTVLVVRQILTAVNGSNGGPGGGIDESVVQSPLFRIPLGR